MDDIGVRREETRRTLTSHVPVRSKSAMRLAVNGPDQTKTRQIGKDQDLITKKLNLECPSTSQIFAELSSSGGFVVRDCKKASRALNKRLGAPALPRPKQYEIIEKCPRIEKEEDFMANLLHGLDEECFDDVSSSIGQASNGPVKQVTSSPLPSLDQILHTEEFDATMPILPDSQEQHANLSSHYSTDSALLAEVTLMPNAQLLDPQLAHPLASSSSSHINASPKTPKNNSVKGLDDFDICEGFDEDDFTFTQTSPINQHSSYAAGHNEKESPRHQIRPAPCNFSDPRQFSRCRVLKVLDQDVDCKVSSMGTEKILEVEILKVGEFESKEKALVWLLDDWALEEVTQGDIVNIIGEFATTQDDSFPKVITLDRRHGFMIRYPDMLITVTSIADATSCTRKSLLKEMIRQSGPSDNSPSLMYGNMIHLLLQRCLARCVVANEDVPQKLFFDQGFNMKAMGEEIDGIISESLEKLWINGISIEVAKKQLMETGLDLRRWASLYMQSSHGLPNEDAHVTDARNGDTVHTRMLITALADIEEDIQSPMWGLRGKIDLSVAIKETEGPLTNVLIRPLELKSGKRSAVFEHDVQTMLYTLLMSERYGKSEIFSWKIANKAPDTKVGAGLLFYTKTMSTSRVVAPHNELGGILRKRNELASILQTSNQGPSGETTAGRLPPPIDNAHICKRCFQLGNCMLYNSAVEAASGEGRNISELFDQYTSHLSQTHRNFFKHWEQLLTLEERESATFKRLQWTSTAHDREALGYAFADMSVVRGSRNVLDRGSVARIQRWTYTFRRSQWQDRSVVKSMLAGHIEVGTSVSVSIGTQYIGIAKGYVTELYADSITINCDRPLSGPRKKLSRFQPQNNQVFDFGHITSAGACPKWSEEHLYRIDKDEYASGLSRVRDNLVKLFDPKAEDRLARFIVDLERPRFSAADLKVDPQIFATLNADQQKAVHKVLSAQDYTYILGMPGTGKTTTIARLIEILIKRGHTVLVAAYTHSAVDNILLKLVKSGIEPLRLGNIDKIHPGLKEYSWSCKDQSLCLSKLEDRMTKPTVVGTTSLSLDHTLFARRRFDYCIVDEASQVTLPVCIGPLRFADKFVLVGDHLQLPPVIRSSRALALGLEQSLFKILTDAHPDAGAYLCTQYRMNADIMSISNRLIYGGRLRCGSIDVAKRTLQLPKKLHVERLHNLAHPCLSATNVCWLAEIMDARRSVIFVDIDQVPAMESETHDSNEVEAELITLVTDAFIRSGVKQEDIGVISTYRKQVRRLKSMLKQHKELEILTADKSQGRDKECILVSLVRSNKDGVVGNLLEDWRRVNVSFTRARSKLLVFGSQRTLASNALLNDFVDMMKARNWVLTLPVDALLMHKLVNDQKDIKRELSSPMKALPIAKRAIKRFHGQPILARRNVLGDITNAI